MDEYFCPKCDATLNNQSGFDPYDSTWTCTSCGQFLFDEDVDNGDTYSGVAWFCDSCGVLLNKQSGFSDIYGSWTCTECYHENGTTEDDIYESKEDYEYQKTVSEWSGVVSSIFSNVFSGLGNSSNHEDDEDDNSSADYTPRSSTSEPEWNRASEKDAELEKQRQIKKHFKGNVQKHLYSKGNEFPSNIITEI